MISCVWAQSICTIFLERENMISSVVIIIIGNYSTRRRWNITWQSHSLKLDLLPTTWNIYSCISIHPSINKMWTQLYLYYHFQWFKLENSPGTRTVVVISNIESQLRRCVLVMIRIRRIRKRQSILKIGQGQTWSLNYWKRM